MVKKNGLKDKEILEVSKLILRLSKLLKGCNQEQKNKVLFLLSVTISNEDLVRILGGKNNESEEN